MEEIFIRTWTLPEWLCKKYFKNIDYVSVEDLISIIEDLDSDKERLEDELEDIKNDLEENYRPFTSEEMYGISDRDFI